MGWLGQIRPHRRDESWSTSLWQTFFSTAMGAQIPAIAEKPLAGCGCRKFQIDPLGVTFARVLPTRMPRRLTIRRLTKLLTSFAQPIKQKRDRWLGVGVNNVGTLIHRERY